MLQKLLTVILLIVLTVSVGWMFSKKDQPISDNKILATLYKSPYCGCCGEWGLYMEDNGYEVATILEEDMNKVKEKFQIPDELGSCHTAEIDGYIVEGHIPNEAVEKLLEDRPDIKGIGMAGMPSGSPGMPGIKEDFLIYEINHDGTKGDLFLKL